VQRVGVQAKQATRYDPYLKRRYGDNRKQILTYILLQSGSNHSPNIDDLEGFRSLLHFSQAYFGRAPSNQPQPPLPHPFPFISMILPE